MSGTIGEIVHRSRGTGSRGAGVGKRKRVGVLGMLIFSLFLFALLLWG